MKSNGAFASRGSSWKEKSRLEKVFILSSLFDGVKIPNWTSSSFLRNSLDPRSPKISFWLRRANLIVINRRSDWKFQTLQVDHS
jgi:hypothetical protein